MAGRFQRSLSFGPGDYEGGGGAATSYRRNTSVVASTLWSILTASRASHPSQSSLATSPTGDAPDSPSGDSEERKQAEAWTQATYNAVALVCVFVTGCIVVAVYYILEPFLYPLLWAVLIGTVLHPVKQAGTSGIREWLCYLDESSIPLSVGIMFCPIFFVKWLTVQFEYIVYSNMWTLMYSTVGVAALWLMYALNLPLHFFRLLQFVSSVLHTVDSVMSYTGLLQVCTVSVGFVVLLVLTHKSEYATVMKVLSVSLWLLFLLNIGAYLFGNMAIPVVIILFLTAAILSVVSKDSFVVSRKRKKGQFKKSESSPLKTPPSKHKEGNVLEEGITLKTAAALAESEDFADHETSVDIENTPPPSESEHLQTPQPNTQQAATATQTHDGDAKTSPDGTETLNEHTSADSESTITDFDITGSSSEERTAFKSASKDASHRHTVSFKPDSTLATEEDELKEDDTVMTVQELASHTSQPTTAVHEIDGNRIKHNFMTTTEERKKKARGQSNQVFLILTSACLIVLLWKYPFFLLMLVPLSVLCLLKFVVSFAVVKDSFICKLPEVTLAVMSWVRRRKRVLFPSPMPMLVRMYVFVDRKILNFVKNSTSSLLSAFIIISLVIVSVSGVVLLIIAVQVELTHYMGVAVGVWNRTIAENPHVTEWLGEGNETLQSTFDLFADQSYVYSREWLANKLHSLAGGSDANTSIVENRILNLFDQLYQSYVLKNTSSTYLITGYRDNATAGFDHNDMLWYELQKIASDNLETIITVLHSLWFIFSENIALAFSLLYALLELLFTGGTALINVVVFITALFYLLSYSETDYLPVKWVTDLLPHLTQPPSSSSSGGGSGGEGGGGEDQGKAFSRTIRSVFHASLRRALFYGLYTWLIHTMFGLPVSILPSVLAAIAGAIPFVGSYWLVVPAVLELWLMDGAPVAALALLALSLLPYFFVETLINREIEGGHPYLTGLAIAGGIYFAGLEGAIFGPILLCCLLFFVDFYGGVFN